MLKTNTKAARKNVLEYIKTNVADYMTETMEYNNKHGINQSYYSTDNDSDVCSFIYSRFMDETGGRSYNMSEQAAFYLWASGLACGGLFDYFCHSAVKDLGDILEETEEERARFTEMQAEELLTKLIYREVKMHLPY